MTERELTSELLTLLESQYITDCEDRSASVMIFTKENGLRMIELGSELDRRINKLKLLKGTQ